jgi:hypothetical protein
MPTQLSKPPRGVAFEIDDLIALRAWANDHDVQMAIELGSEDYEELLSFQAQRAASQRWVMWRTSQDVVVKPLIGRPRRFPAVNAMMEAMKLVIGQPAASGHQPRGGHPGVASR